MSPVASSVASSPVVSFPVSPVAPDVSRLVIRKRRASPTAVDAELQAERDFYENMLNTVDAEGKRVISDSTEELVKTILNTLQPEHSTNETRKASFDLNRRLFEKRLEEDRKYQDAFLKFKELERDAWFLRYGDYLAISLSDLRGPQLAGDKKPQPAGEKKDRDPAYDMFMSRPWADILEQIELELHPPWANNGG
jgi:hypothetical protein